MNNTINTTNTSADAMKRMAEESQARTFTKVSTIYDENKRSYDDEDIDESDLVYADLVADLYADAVVESAEDDYALVCELLNNRGIDPSTVEYYTVSNVFTMLAPAYTITVTKLMSPAQLREANTTLLTQLIADKKALSDFRDANIVDVITTHSYASAVDVLRVLEGEGTHSVGDLYYIG